MPVVSGNWDEVIKWRDVYSGQLIVVRIDSALAEDAETVRRLGKQIAYLRHSMNLRVIVVQGGSGPETLNTDVRSDALCVADKASREVNDGIAETFKKACKGCVTPVSLAGYDKNLVEVHPLAGNEGKTRSGDLMVATKLFASMLEAQNELFLPVVYPFCAIPGASNDAPRYRSVDADEFALAVASDLKAHRLILCSNSPGVLSQEGTLIPEIFIDQIEDLVAQSAIRADVAPRLAFAGKAVERMEKGGVAIMDVRYPDSLLNELLSDQGGGTLVRRRPARPADRDFPFVPAARCARLTG